MPDNTIELDQDRALELVEFLYSLCDKDADPLADHILELLERIEFGPRYKRVKGGWVQQ